MNLTCEALYTGSNIFFGVWANMEENSALTSASLNGSSALDADDATNPLTAGLNRTVVSDHGGAGKDAQVL